MSHSPITIGDIVKISKGKKHSVVDDVSISSKRLIGIDDLRNNDLIRYTDDPHGTEVEFDDVLIAWDGANAGTIGYGKKGLIGSTIARLRFKEKDKFHAAFVGEFLKSKFDYLRQTATGATIPHVSRKALEKISIPDLDFNDQKRITHLLGKVEGLITQRKQHLQQLDDLLKSVFLEMFGDPVRNDKGWKTKTLPQLVLPGKNSLKRGPFGGALKKETFVDSGYLVYEQNHALNNDYSFQRYFVTEKKYNELIDFKVVPNDILISCSGVYLGKLSIVPERAKPGIINQALLKVSLDSEKMKQVFFVYVFGSTQFKKKYFPSNRGGAIPNLPPMAEMKKIEFICPPIGFQNQFNAIFEKVEDTKTRYQQSLDDLENLYGALSQKAFKGELDLSSIPLPDFEEIESKLEINAATENDEALAVFSIEQMASVEGRRSILKSLFKEYLADKDNIAKTLDKFWSEINFKTLEYSLFESGDFPERQVTVDDYDHVKEWIFEKLRSGRFEQKYLKDEKGVQLQVVKA